MTTYRAGGGGGGEGGKFPSPSPHSVRASGSSLVNRRYVDREKSPGGNAIVLLSVAISAQRCK